MRCKLRINREKWGGRASHFGNYCNDEMSLMQINTGGQAVAA